MPLERAKMSRAVCKTFFLFFITINMFIVLFFLLLRLCPCISLGIINGYDSYLYPQKHDRAHDYGFRITVEKFHSRFRNHYWRHCSLKYLPVYLRVREDSHEISFRRERKKKKSDPYPNNIAAISSIVKEINNAFAVRAHFQTFYIITAKCKWQ